VKTEGIKTILIGNIYHSSNSSSENYEYLRCIEECGRLEYKRVVIMGDFDIHWDTWNGRSEKDAKCIETIQGNFLYQHVDQPTRYRIGQNPTLDELVLSNTEELIQDLTYLDPLGKSDHICLIFTIDVVPEISKSSQIKYKMDKGDYEKMRSLFGAINWETELDGKEVGGTSMDLHTSHK